jgi:hypothetical protein
MLIYQGEALSVDTLIEVLQNIREQYGNFPIYDDMDAPVTKVYVYEEEDDDSPPFIALASQ